MIGVSAILVVLVGGAIAYLINYLAHSNKTGRPLPPGPKGLPLLGNVNDLPKPGVLECHHWAEHRELYGPISSLTVLGQPFIIINDAQLALELLRDRSATYSARPHMVFSSDMYVCFTCSQSSPNKYTGSVGRRLSHSLATRTLSSSIGPTLPRLLAALPRSTSSTVFRRKNRLTSFSTCSTLRRICLITSRKKPVLSS
jgi:hypothetical protein